MRAWPARAPSVLSGVALTLAVAACAINDGDYTAYKGSGGAAIATTTTTAMGTASSTSGTSVTGTGGAMGNHTFSTATPLNVNDLPVMGTLTGTTKKDADYYSFTGKANERIVINAYASTTVTTNDPTVVEPAVGLYDSNQMLLAEQFNRWPQNDFHTTELFVQLPSDGTYYVEIQDCNGFFFSGCPNPAAGVSDLGYDLEVLDTNQTLVPETFATNQDGTIGKAVPINYTAVPGNPGFYYNEIIGGQFQSATDTHVFKFTPPADEVLLDTGAQARAEFFVQPIGGAATHSVGGDLSQSNIKVWVTDSTGNVILSRADQSHFLDDNTAYSPLDFSVPISKAAGTYGPYYLFVQNTHTGGSPTTDFYFIHHFLNYYYNVAEKEPNSHAPTPPVASGGGAQVLPTVDPAKSFYCVDGNLSPFTEDDYYSLTVPSGMSQYQVYCDAARSGSGLGGFTMTLLEADGATSIATGFETVCADINSPWRPIPAGQVGAIWYLKASATSQDATDTGTQYRCRVFFN